MNFDLLKNLMLVGAIQGIAFAILMFFSDKIRSKTNLFLTLLILTFALNNLQYFFWEIDLIDGDFFYGLIYIPYASLSMVFYFFYVKLFLYPDNPITKRQKLLYLPFILFFASTVYYKIGDAFEILSDSTYIFFDRLIYVDEIFSLIYSLILIIFCFKLIFKFEKEQILGKTQIPKVGLSWLKIILLSLFFLCIAWIFSVYDELKNGSENVTYYYLLWTAISFLIYILGHIGIYRFGILQEQRNIKKVFADSRSQIKSTSYSQNENILAFEKYVKTEKLYLDSNLSLEMIAEKLNLNKSYLSRIINAELGKSFSDYVNELRVEEAKNYLTNPEFSNYTLISIGLEAGFNSKSVFNSTFKKFTGKTPSEYKKNT